MENNLPYYLNASIDGSNSLFENNVNPLFDLKVDYVYPDRNGEVSYDSESFFDTPLNYISSGISKALDTVKSAYSGIKEESLDLVDSALWRGGVSIAFLIAGLLVIVWIVAKSGILKDSVEILKIVM